MKLKKFGPNVEGNDYVIGDVHGNWYNVVEAMQVVGFDEDVDRLFCVGDMIDRGPNSEDCIHWLRKPWFHTVRGNHEQMAIDTFRDEFPAHAYAYNGGLWFLGMQTAEQQYYVDLFDELPYAIEIEMKDGSRVGIVHAEVPNDDWASLNYENVDKEDLLWSRVKIDHKDTTRVAGIDRVYVGHTPQEMVVKLGNMFYIDTGSVYDSGELTIIKLN